MNEQKRVIWSEGMFLRPQHFQQHDRYLENLVDSRCRPLKPYDWGFSSLTIDQHLLKIGKVALTECKGIFPDGTPFNLPEDGSLPLPLDIPKDIHNEIVLLALPVYRPQAVEIDNDLYPDSLARFRLGDFNAKDSNSGLDSSAQIQIGELKTRLILQNHERSGYTCLGVVRINEMRVDKGISLDDEYVTPSLNCFAAPVLSGFLRELYGLLNARGEALASRVHQAGHGGISEIADFLLLQLINRYQPLFEHLSNLNGLHPDFFYGYAIQLAGELSTFFMPEKRPPAYPRYDHDDLQATFIPLMEELRRLFSGVIEPMAIRIPLSKPKFGVYAAKRPDTQLLENALFVLAANAKVPPETLRNLFPPQITIGPVEDIQKLVGSAIPGVSLHPLPVAPRQIPYHVGFTYFELNKHCDFWDKIKTSGGVAFHIGGDFPELELEFWAIKKVD